MIDKESCLAKNIDKESWLMSLSLLTDGQTDTIAIATDQPALEVDEAHYLWQ